MRAHPKEATPPTPGGRTHMYSRMWLLRTASACRSCWMTRTCSNATATCGTPSTTPSWAPLRLFWMQDTISTHSWYVFMHHFIRQPSPVVCIHHSPFTFCSNSTQHAHMSALEQSVSIFLRCFQILYKRNLATCEYPTNMSWNHVVEAYKFCLHTARRSEAVHTLAINVSMNHTG